jgi:hypothetical protein
MKESVHLEQWYESFVTYMEGISKQVGSSTANIEKMTELKNYLNELDRRRKTNWPALYPWLVEHFDKHNIS